MIFNKIQHIICYGIKGREYVIRNKMDNIDEIQGKDYKIVYEDDCNWDGCGVLMVILDGGEPITLEMLKQKRIELEDKERFKLLRELRDKLLAETDYITNPDYPVGNREEWLYYRQQLRDLPQTQNPRLNELGNLDLTSITLPKTPIVKPPSKVSEVATTNSNQENQQLKQALHELQKRLLNLELTLG